MPSAQSLLLQYPIELVTRQGGLDLFAAMTDHHVNGAGRQCLRGLHHMLQQGLTRHAVQYFGQARFHPGALSGGKNYNF